MAKRKPSKPTRALLKPKVREVPVAADPTARGQRRGASPAPSPSPVTSPDPDPTEPGLPWEQLSPEERSPLRSYLDQIGKTPC